MDKRKDDDFRNQIVKLKQELRNENKEYQAQKQLAQKQKQSRYHKLDSRAFGENLKEFASQKKEMMVLLYSLHIKQVEIERLDLEITGEEEKIRLDEQELERQIVTFDAFLKQNDKSTMDAIKQAEMEMKNRVEKTQELKRQTYQLVNFKNDLVKFQDQLDDLETCRDFLHHVSTTSTKNDTTKNDTKDDVSDINADKREKEEELGFGEPWELLDIFTSLEESNLSLIQLCQDAEDSMEDLNSRLLDLQSDSYTHQLTSMIYDIIVRVRMEEVLRDKNEKIRSNVYKQQEILQNYKNSQKAILDFGAGDETRTKILEDLNIKVRDAYMKCCIAPTPNSSNGNTLMGSVSGTGAGNLSTISMLTMIETKLEKLFDIIDNLPVEKVEAAEKTVEKEKRLKLRDSVLEGQKKEAEERARKALERALGSSMVGTKGRVDKKLLYKPRLFKKLEKISGVVAKEEEEELLKYLNE